MLVGPAHLLLAVLGLEAQVSVRAAEGRVDVSASGAPVSLILQNLSNQTGMKVLYDGAPPRELVTLFLEHSTPAQAVIRLLEGLGLSYALVSDASGERVDVLLIVSASSGVRPPSPGGEPPARPAQPEPAEVDVDDFTEAVMEVEELERQRAAQAVGEGVEPEPPQPSPAPPSPRRNDQ